MVPSGLLPRRAAPSHKGDYGHVLCVAGSVGMTGAAVLCVRAALRAGAGLVTLASCKGLHGVMAAQLTESMFLPLPQTEQGSLASEAASLLIARQEKFSVLALGPGLSQGSETQAMVRQLLRGLKQPVVVDADGLNALVGHVGLLNEKQCPSVLTPHPGELARLLGVETRTVQADRHAYAQRFAAQAQGVIVLKGHHTLIAEPGGDVYTNKTGNAGMATGGSGDVLTGIIAGFIAQGMPLLDAARLGAYVHGLAGDLAAQKTGEISLLAGDILDTIPSAIQQYQAAGVAQG